MSTIFWFEIHRAPSELLLPRKAELARQASRYLWRGWVDFKKNLDHFSSTFFKLKMVISRLESLVHLLKDFYLAGVADLFKLKYKFKNSPAHAANNQGQSLGKPNNVSF